MTPKKNRKYPADRNRLGRRKLTERPSSRPISKVRSKPVPLCCTDKKLRGQETRERAHHHGGRHRIACLGRIDHQVKRGVPEDNDENERKRAGRIRNRGKRKAERHHRGQDIQRDHLKPGGKHRQHKARARRILHHQFPGRRHQGVAGRHFWIVPVWIIDRLQFFGEIMIVIAGHIRVQAIKVVFLEQMGLPQIADVVVNAPALAPARYRPNIAGENGEQSETAEYLPVFHHHSRRARLGRAGYRQSFRF